MNSKLNVKQWLIASIAVFVVLSILEFLVGRFLLGPWVAQLMPAAPQPENMMMARLWIYLGRLISSVMFAFVFTQGYEGKPGIGEGLRYGLWIALMVQLPVFFTSLVTTSFGVDFLITRLVASVVQMLVCGVVVGLIYKGQKTTTA